MSDDDKDKPRRDGGGGDAAGGDRKAFVKRDGKPSRGKPAGDKRPSGKPFGARPGADKPFRSKPQAARPGGKTRAGHFERKSTPDSGGEPRRFERKPGGGRGDKPFQSRPGGDKPLRNSKAAGPGGDKRPHDPERKPRSQGAGSGEERHLQRMAGPSQSGPPFGPRPDGGKAYTPRSEGDRRSGGFERRPGPEGAEGGQGGRFARQPGRERDVKPFTQTPEPGKPHAPRPQGGRPDKPFASGSPGGKPYAARPPSGQRRFEGKDRTSGASVATPFAPRDRVAAPAEPGERIAKRLARAGIASRRDAEELIAAGRVRVNGRVLTSPAVNVMPDDRIEVDNTQIPAIERTRLFLFNKPAGVVTTNRDPEGRRTVFDVLPSDLPRLITIGRLDINTEGLLLLTNDGGLARVLELPATGWLRRYRVRVHGQVEESALTGLREGIAVGGVFYGAIEATLDREQGSNAWLTLGLREGKNREVKNILGSLGLDVTRLIRISYGPFQLGDLPEGHVQEIKGRTLRDQLGERLIEESGANFEADIVTPFSNRPERREPERGEPIERPTIVRDGVRGRIEEGGLVKNRKKARDKGPGRSREEALSQLTTAPKGGGRGDPREKRPPRGGGDAAPAKRGKRPEKPEEPRRPRSSNVWMAPGARPQGKTAEEGKPRSGRSSVPKVRGKGPGSKPRGPAGGGASKGAGGPGPSGSGGPGRGRTGADRRR